MGSTGDSPVPVGDSPTGRARPQLRRSDLFVENGSDPGESPVGAASSASMPLLRGFGILPFAIYKDTAPLGLGKALLASIQRQLASGPGCPKMNFRTRSQTKKARILGKGMGRATVAVAPVGVVCV